MKQLITRLMMTTIVAGTLTAGCSKTPEQDPVVAIVNGEKIYKSTLAEFLPPHARDQDITPYFDRLRERAIHVELAFKKALQEVKADDPELTKELSKVRQDVVLDQFRHKLKLEYASGDKLKDAYEKFKKENPSELEIRARHILVDSEKEAQDVETKLAAGADFGKLASEVSKDKGAKAGDLGYFRADDMVKPFSEKAFALRDAMAKRLKNENFNEKAGDRGIVKTDFGWHVIEVLGSRSSTYPPMEEMQETLEANAMKAAIDQVTDKLRKDKKVELFNLDGTPYQEGHKLEKATNLNPDQVLVKIDDKNYTKKDLLTLIPNAATDMNIQPFYDKLIKEFVRRELMREEAARVIPANDPEVQKEINAITHRLIVNLYLEREVKKKLNDQDMQKLYQEYLVKNPPVDEVHARHILVESEDAAKAIVQELNGGADFGKIAIEQSKDKASGDGDLGFFRYEDMVPEFSAKAFSLKPKEYGIAKSTFGWHVIELLEKRQTKQQSFDEAKALLHPQASQKIVDELLTELKKAAKVELFDLPKPEKAADEKKADDKVAGKVVE